MTEPSIRHNIIVVEDYGIFNQADREKLDSESTDGDEIINHSYNRKSDAHKLLV